LAALTTDKRIVNKVLMLIARYLLLGVVYTL